MSCSSINNLPTPVLNNSSPYFVLFHKHPDYSTQKPFGYTIFSTPCVYLGPSPSHSGSRCLNLSNDMVYIASHVVFNPSLFLYCSHIAASQAPKDFQISRGFTLKVYLHHPRVMLEIQVKPLLALIFLYFLPLINLQIIPYC